MGFLFLVTQLLILNLTLQMPKVVISDTSSLIIFQKICELELLKIVYDNLFTTPEIAEEFEDHLPEWIIIRSVKDRKYLEFLNTQVDLGEASAIALAKEMEDTLLLLDDLKARRLAKRLNIKFTGTLGVITKAKELGVIGNVKPIIDKLLKTDFRISEKIIKEILTINNETTDFN